MMSLVDVNAAAHRGLVYRRTLSDRNREHDVFVFAAEPVLQSQHDRFHAVNDRCRVETWRGAAARSRFAVRT